MCFWTKLKSHADGANMLGNLTFMGALLDQHQDTDGYKPKLIQARKASNCYVFTKVAAKLSDDESIQKVIWMPWKDGNTVAAQRTIYEPSTKADYFMTSYLSGCRFSVTDEVVLHVANRPERRIADSTCEECR